MTQPTDFIESYRRAVESLDVDAVLDHYTEDTRVFDAMEPAEHPDRDAWAEQVRMWLGSLKTGTFDLDEVQVMESDDLAVITGIATYDGSFPDGSPADLVARITWVLERDGERWRIAHEHNSVPIEEEDDEDHLHDDFGDSDDDHDDDDNDIEDETGLPDQDETDVEDPR